MSLRRHPSEDTLHHYVMGILPAEESSELEAHVAACEPCAERLASEARFELAMDLIAQGIGVGVGAVPLRVIPRRPPRLSRRPFGAGAAISGALAMAAVMLLFVGRASSETEPTPTVSPASVVSLDGDITVRPPENVDGG